MIESTRIALVRSSTPRLVKTRRRVSSSARLILILPPSSTQRTRKVPLLRASSRQLPSKISARFCAQSSHGPSTAGEIHRLHARSQPERYNNPRSRHYNDAQPPPPPARR